MFKIILFLYFANLILDYPLQGEFLATHKAKNNYILFVHSAIWSIGISLCLMYFNLFAVWKLLMLLIGHMVIDAWKCRGWYKGVISDWTSLYIDQVLHIVQIILCLL